MARSPQFRKSGISHRCADNINCLSHGLFLVVLCGVEHGVEDCGELRCAGCDGDLCGVCGVLQAFSECREGRVIAACDDGGEVKGVADIGATAPEVTLAAMEARVAGVGCEAREACDAPVVQLAQLGRAGDQDGDLGGDLAGRL